MAFTPAEEARLRALMNQDTSLLTLATNEPAIIQELGAQDVTIDELQLASSLLQTDKLLGRFGGDDKAVVLSVLSQFLKGSQGLGLGSAAYKDVGVGAGQIPDVSQFMSGGVGNNRWFKFPGGMIYQTIQFEASGVGQFGVNYPTTFPNSAIAASLTCIDHLSDITISPTFKFNDNGSIILYNHSAGNNTISVIVSGY